MSERVAQRAVIHAPPEKLFEVVTDYERYPEWARDLKHVQVLSRDDQGRGLEVQYRAAAMGRSTTYILRYDYRDAPHRLPWVLARGDIMRRLDGNYELRTVEDDPGATEVVYRLAVELIVPLPTFVKRRAETKIMHNALRELKVHVEGL